MLEKNRLYGDYYLDEWGINKIDGEYQLGCDPCSLCELCDDCDRLADELDDISYCMCLSQGIIKDTEYKEKHPEAYFKKINVS